MMIQTLLRDRYFRVDLQPRDRLYRIARTEEPFPDLAATTIALTTLETTLRDVSGALLLLDTRDAPARNDGAFEAKIIEHRDRLFGRFARVAILVRTAAGRLQTSRLSRDSKHEVRTFDDEDAALQFLLG